MWVIGGLLAFAGLALPLGMLLQADPSVIPSDLPVNAWFMFHLPAALGPGAIAFWGGAFVALLAVSLVPWVLVRKPLEPVRVDPEAGKKLYYETALGNNASCRICHSLQEGVVLVGPSFYGVAERAASRVPGLSAEEYLRQSILEPGAYVVEGFPSGQMPPNLGDILTEQQISDIIAFLLQN